MVGVPYVIDTIFYAPYLPCLWKKVVLGEHTEAEGRLMKEALPWVLERFTLQWMVDDMERVCDQGLRGGGR
ncbi:MAG: hypothetical protein NT045_03630 [Candidatus Aureabacteria bacterium]|nr:hypothetical protein [Candidatus Auribacterota bacterium]